ncbi:methyltransferase [Campylobacter volucris]|uniref:tRNA1(Val) (adenine(37)-N6)-methyltransferase n=1 Tax=Campylobacter volucris TaxID=1031542 RepID=UPI0018A00D8E|nr:methyltransferase [Campylobacter volucris]MBF7047797.1 methyltransferase [Campylobacter volucris]
MLKLFQYPKGYRYNNDSLLLFDFLSKQNLQGNVLDIGCGCGILGILIKQKFPNSKVFMLDIQQKNIDLTCKNSIENGLNVKTICQDFLYFKSDIRFDYLVSNPPFYKQNTQKTDNLHMNISRYQEFMPLEKMIAKINSIIKPNGKIYMCYEAEFLDAICAYFMQYKIKLTKLQFIHSNNAKSARLILLEARKNSKSPIEILPPLFMYENDKLSQAIEEIYKTTGTISYDLQ